jgi:putative (di)nucleoside polyphosphate hydrolase
MPEPVDPARLTYRPCVGVMLVNRDGHVFVGKRIDNREGDFWQMPQGGIDDGEIVATAREELLYDLPEELMGTLWGGKYRGQRQIWMLIRFTGTDDDIDLDAHDPPEFCEFRWVEPELLPELIVPFKKRVYRTVLEEFRELI